MAESAAVNQFYGPLLIGGYNLHSRNLHLRLSAGEVLGVGGQLGSPPCARGLHVGSLITPYPGTAPVWLPCNQLAGILHAHGKAVILGPGSTGKTLVSPLLALSLSASLCPPVCLSLSMCVCLSLCLCLSLSLHLICLALSPVSTPSPPLSLSLPRCCSVPPLALLVFVLRPIWFFISHGTAFVCLAADAEIKVGNGLFFSFESGVGKDIDCFLLFFSPADRNSGLL